MSTSVLFFAEPILKLADNNIPVTMPNAFWKCVVPCVVKDVDEDFFDIAMTSSAAELEEQIDNDNFSASSYDQLALVIAVLQGKVDILRVLLAQLKKIGDFPCERVLVEAIGADNVEMLSLLLEAMKDETDRYAIAAPISLSRAARFGSLSVVSWLLESAVGISSGNIDLVLKEIDKGSEGSEGSLVDAGLGKSYRISEISYYRRSEANREAIRSRLLAVLEAR